jgi:amino acid transporter
MGWNYVFGWLIVLPLEITAAGTTASYWPNNVPLGAWVTIFYVRGFTLEILLLTIHL